MDAIETHYSFTREGISFKKKRTTADTDDDDAASLLPSKTLFANIDRVRVTKAPRDLFEAVAESSEIIFDFSLVDPDGIPRAPTQEESEVLSNLFPTQYAFTVVPPMITVHVRTLPPKPWPLTVAGLPLYVATDESSTGNRHGRQGSGVPAIDHLDAKLRVTKEIFTAAVDFFKKKLEIQVDCLQWTIGRWKITVPDGTDMKNVPSLLANCLCRYVFTSEEVEPPEPALGLLQPTSVRRDDSRYDKLRPGVMISSGKFADHSNIVPARNELYTTSGVLVKDGEREVFVTVANCGFPLGEERVYHPEPSGQVIGEVVRRINGTDIRPGPSSGKTVRAIRDVEDMGIYDFTYMDNPFTGCSKGQYLGTRYKRIPADELGMASHSWVFQGWFYLGQGTLTEPMAGSGGSAILDGDGRVVCFFRSQGMEGHGIGMAATELKEYGLVIA
ncbi:MAG: hypothetical protein M1816_002318 [Peltula sp. TS41687]|nr:MAG: hypothetical protein M1816_002318 [Peltula sp. TS41687]